MLLSTTGIEEKSGDSSVKKSGASPSVGYSVSLNVSKRRVRRIISSLSFALVMFPKSAALSLIGFTGSKVFP